MYEKLVFCTIVRPYVVYVILPWLRPPESEKAGNLPGFGHTMYGGGPHSMRGSAIHCMSQAPYIVRARPRAGNLRLRSFKQGRRHEAQRAVRIKKYILRLDLTYLRIRCETSGNLRTCSVRDTSKLTNSMDTSQNLKVTYPNNN